MSFAEPRAQPVPDTYTPVSTFGALLIQAMAPWMTLHLAWYLDAIGGVVDPLYLLVSDVGVDGDADYLPGYGSLFNIQPQPGQAGYGAPTCPTSDLPYVAQFVGVQIPVGSSDATARSLVLAESGLNRGTDCGGCRGGEADADGHAIGCACAAHVLGRDGERWLGGPDYAAGGVREPRGDSGGCERGEARRDHDVVRAERRVHVGGGDPHLVGGHDDLGPNDVHATVKEQHPMPSTPTPRLGLTAPAGGDAVVLYPSLMQADLNTLDNAVTFTKGTISARPAAALAGRRYYATDTGLYYEDNGATWQTLQFAPQDTGWLVLTSPPTGVLINGGAGRLVGDAIRFEGHITNSSGSSIAAGTTLATVPTAVRPVGVRVMAGALGSSGGVPSAPVSVSVSASGPLSMSASLPNGMDLILDGGVIYVP